MSKTVSQIRNEIANFYLSIQNEITDVSTGSVSGGLIYSLAVSLKTLYDTLDSLERQAFIATATGRYLDLLIEGGFFLPRPGSSRSTGYVMVYGDDPIVSPVDVGNNLICAEYDLNSDSFISDISAATKFTGTNSFGSNSVSYVLTSPKNKIFVKKDALGRTVIDLKGKKAKYFLLPVASILKGTQVNISEGSLDTFSNPPSGLRYVTNINNPSEVIFGFGGISSAPLYSRLTTLLSYSAIFNRLRVVNSFNFSSAGFLDISYRSDFPTRLARGIYRSQSGEEITAGLVFQYSSKTQTSISLSENNSFVLKFENNLLTRYDLISFFYNNIRYFKHSNFLWGAETETLLGEGTPIGPTTFVDSDSFFVKFFNTEPWVVQQTREQVSDDIVFDPDNVLTDLYNIKDGFKLSLARDQFDDEQYRNYFSSYINSLPRGTKSALEFAALQVPGITFAKTVPPNELPTGTAVILASSENGQLSVDRKQALHDFLKNDWVSAGITLFVKAPTLIEFSISVSVVLEGLVFENSVKDSINTSLSLYLNSKQPGDTIKYGEIYSIISNIPGVRGVSELVIGKFEPDHFVKYAGNYVKVALDKLSEYKPTEYFTREETTFRDLRNEIIIASDINDGVHFSPVSFSDFDNVLSSSYMFSENNKNQNNERVVYAALPGIFSSDGGGFVSSDSFSYSITPYTDIPSSVKNKTLGVRFSTSSTDSVISVSLGNFEMTSSDVGEFRTLFLDIPNDSTDYTLTFSSSDEVFIENIQMFLHGDGFDTHLIGDYEGLQALTFVDKDRVLFIYGVSSPSSRYKKLKVVGYFDEEEYPGRLLSLFGSLVKASSISSFQTILRDFQYGQNLFGENLQKFEDSFADVSKSNDAFIHFFVYANTSPFSDDLNLVYPLNPTFAKNNEISDYTLSTRQISRFSQAVIAPRVGLSPLIGIKVLSVL
jgi:hypothetical protein